MKSIVKTLKVVALLGFLMGCQQTPNVVGILNNPEYRLEVFDEIVKDHELMNAFMERAMTDDHAKMMMQSNKGMMEMMMSHNQEMMSFMKDHPELAEQTMGNMMSLASEDTTMMLSIMDMMVKDHSMMSAMMDRMHKQGIMDQMTTERGKEMLKKEIDAQADKSHHN